MTWVGIIQLKLVLPKYIMNKPDVYCKISRQIIEKRLSTLNVFQQPKYINFAIRLLLTDL